MHGFAWWIKESSTEHIVVASVLPSALVPGSDLSLFLNRASVCSLHESMLLHKGSCEEERPCQLVSRELATAVADATADKFILELWEGTFIIVHRFMIEDIDWKECVTNLTETRCGTLKFSFPRDRMRQPDCTIGIVQIPSDVSNTYPKEPTWDTITGWMQRDNPMLVTGSFGKGS